MTIGGDDDQAEPVHRSVEHRWTAFLQRFFRHPNEIAPGQGIVDLDAAVADAERLVAAEPAGPVLLPAKVSTSTRYYGVAFDGDQARSLRDLLRAFIGTTWSDFDGRPLVAHAAFDELDDAVIALADGDPRNVFRLNIADTARARARRQVRALTRSLIERPQREAHITKPIGRLLGDFEDACAVGAEQAANNAFDRLASDFRISAANHLFLHVQLLSAFGRWAELNSLQGIDEVLRLPRPTLVSDALARLAIVQLPSATDTAAFAASVAPRFGALISSIGAIRSIAGARYYTMWSLLGGEAPDVIAHRFADSQWAQDETVATVLGVAASTKEKPEDKNLDKWIADAMAGGRYDTVVELLSQQSVNDSYLPVVATVVRATLTRDAIDLLDRYRAALGEDGVNAALLHPIPVGVSTSVIVEPSTWAERVNAMLSISTSAVDREHYLDAINSASMGDLTALRGLDDVVTVVRSAIGQPTEAIDIHEGFDGCIDLVREIHRTGAVTTGLVDFALAVVELWAYHDRTGDRRRLRRILLTVDILFDMGLSQAAFDELVELLRLGWDPFLTDSDLEPGLDVIELLATHRPPASNALDLFARPILARIGPHNARRISLAALDVAADLATEFGLAIDVPDVGEREGGADQKLGSVRDGTVVALYSLMESALDRAAHILRRRHPGLSVVPLAGHVSSSELTAVARTADLVVIMDRAAKHAATDAIRAARGHRPLFYAAGKGSTSLITAVEDGLDRIAAWVAA